MITVDMKNARIKISLTLLTRATIAILNDTVVMLPFALDETSKDLSKQTFYSLILFNLSNKIIFNIIDFI